MKKTTILLLIATLIFSLTSLNACKKEESDTSSFNEDEVVVESDDGGPIGEVVEDDGIDAEPIGEEDAGISYDEEIEGNEVNKTVSDPTFFIGSWTAPSDRAKYLYGNVDIKVKEDGTWSGNITGENLSGKWSEKGDCLLMKSDLITFELARDTSGKVIMIDKKKEVNTVLVRK